MGYTIAVQDALSAIKEELEEQGFHVVSMEQSMDPVSAIVYSGVADYWEGLPPVERMEGVMTSGNEEPQGVVLINATGYTPQDVTSLLRQQLGA